MIQRRKAKSNKPRLYAFGTKVPVEDSRAEVEDLLLAHGATHFGILRAPEAATIVFQIGGLRVQRVVLIPTKGTKLEQEKEHKRRWRALLLILKAKLEIVSGGESTLTREFLSDMVLPNGRTVEEDMAPLLLQAVADGKMPRLALPSGAP